MNFNTLSEEHKAVLKNVKEFINSDHNTLGILCKTQKQAKQLYKQLANVKDIHLLTSGSSILKSGILITHIHLAKGLEFDRVIVPYVSTENYHTKVDKSLLYIACTRAMHKLTLTHTGSLSKLIH
ncbi:MAG: 3'-5' exonuclease, partial [Balneolaceae bacterium]